MLRDMSQTPSQLSGNNHYTIYHVHFKLLGISFLCRPQLGLSCVTTPGNKYNYPKQCFVSPPPLLTDDSILGFSHKFFTSSTRKPLTPQLSCWLWTAERHLVSARLAAFVTAILFPMSPHLRQSQSPQLTFLIHHF